jgi:hypothetical protein
MMNVLKYLQTKKRNRIDSKSGWSFIVNCLKNSQYSMEEQSGTTFLLIDGILISIILNKRVIFQGYFFEYYGLKEIDFIEEYLFSKKTTKGYNKGSNNNGHKFERTVAYSLSQLGFSVKGIKPSNEFPEINKSLNLVLNEFPVGKIVKVKDSKNKKSISSDFLGNNINISCKYNNKVLKHPTLMKVFSISKSEKRIDFVNKFEMFQTEVKYTKSEARAEFSKDSEMAKKLSKKIFLELEDSLRVSEIYDYLIGKERPIIITMNPNNTIDIKNTKSWGNPSSYKWILNNDRISIKFNNGVHLIHRFKCAINSKTKTELYKVYKEEWRLLSYPENSNLLIDKESSEIN